MTPNRSDGSNSSGGGGSSTMPRISTKGAELSGPSAPSLLAGSKGATLRLSSAWDTVDIKGWDTADDVPTPGLVMRSSLTGGSLEHWDK